MDKRGWNHRTDKLRTHPSQRFEDQRPCRYASIRKRRDCGSIGRKSPLGKRRETVSGIAAKNLFGIGDDDEGLEEPNDRAQAVDAMKSWAEYQRKWKEWKERDTGSCRSPELRSYAVHVRSPAVKERLARNRKRRANTAYSRIPVPKSKADRWWTGHGNSAKVKDDLNHDSELQASEYECMENSHEGLQDLDLLTLGDENNYQDRAEETNRDSEEDYSPKHRLGMQDSDHKPQPPPSNSGDAFSNDNQLIKWNSTIWDPSGEQTDDHVLLSNPDQNTDETNDRADDAVSDKGGKRNETEIPSETPPDPNRYERDSADSLPQPTLIGASPIHESVEEQSYPETNDIKEVTDTPQPPATMENVRYDTQPKSLRSDLTENIDLQKTSPECGQNKGPYTTQSPNTIYLPEIQIPDSQPKSPGNDMMNLDPQPKSPGNDDRKSPQPNPNLPSDGHITKSDPQPKYPGKDDSKRLDPQPKLSGSDHVDDSKFRPYSPESRFVAAKTNPIQNQAGKDDDPEAWLDSDAPLPGNYRALFDDSREPRSFRPKRSSPPRDGRDSLIVSPAGSDENEESEEDWDSTAIANDEIIRMFDEYKANSRLEPASEGQEAKYLRRARKEADKMKRSLQATNSERLSVSTPSSDGSLIMSSGPYNEESRTNAEPMYDYLETEEQDEEEGEGEESHQAVMNLIELYRAKYELQKDSEAKEAKFKRDIKEAWTRPRPPPTTEEQRRNRAALDSIESKEIFDELGDQQRPITTDPYLVVRETEINIMITRAQACHILEDYRRMYTRANRAVEAASQLKFPPLMARCCYYRGLASYFHRDFSSARDDFLEARGCAGLYGISSESIEGYIQLIDSAVDPQTAILESFPKQKVGRDRKSGGTRRARRKVMPDVNDFSPSSADNAKTLVEDWLKPPEHPSSPPNKEERSTGQQHENADPQIQLSRSPSRTDALRPDSTDDVPTYQPQEEALSEEIRKDILESKAQSLGAADYHNNNNDNNQETSATEKNHSPTERKKKKKKKKKKEKKNKHLAPPSSLANTEWTLLGSATSKGTTARRHVPRPHVAPITTSFAAGSSMRGQALARIFPESEQDMDVDIDGDRGSDEMGSDEIYDAFGGRPGSGEDNTPDSARWSDG